MTTHVEDSFERVADRFAGLTDAIEDQIRRRIVGQEDVVREVLIAFACGGHVLLEGVPGLGKTEMLKALADSVQASFGRIQFTPDLMPADVIGTQVIRTTDAGERDFVFRPGPVFANLVLADEVNRATPKTQSALLEAMQERQVTVAGETRPLPEPFMVLATQNPIELEGTYPLPEAQLDRFFSKVVVEPPGAELLAEILTRTTGTASAAVEPVCSPRHLTWMHGITRQVGIAAPLVAYASLLVTATHPSSPHAPDLVRRYVRAGASPRGGQAMVLAAKARALLDGRPYVAGSDLVRSAAPALRHRILLGYEAAADGIATDDVIDAVVATTSEPGQSRRGIA
jgi:MoxR-like ATPase